MATPILAILALASSQIQVSPISFDRFSSQCSATNDFGFVPFQGNFDCKVSNGNSSGCFAEDVFFLDEVNAAGLRPWMCDLPGSSPPPTVLSISAILSGGSVYESSNSSVRFAAAFDLSSLNGLPRSLSAISFGSLVDDACKWVAGSSYQPLGVHAFQDGPFSGTLGPAFVSDETILDGSRFP